MRHLMTIRWKVLLCALLLLAGGMLVGAWLSSRSSAPVVINETAVPPVPTLAAAVVRQGAGVYAQQCARCHGANLEGAPNWKQPGAGGAYPPPPHDNSGHTWHHPDALLVSIIENGGDPAYQSNMPAFGKTLSRDEILAVLAFLKSNWGREEREFQWWITATGQRD